jgi:hypothetical protein
MSNSVPLKFYEEARTHPVIALALDMNEKIPEIHFGADFMMGRVVTKLENGEEVEAIETTLQYNKETGTWNLPAVAIYEENSKRARVGIGEYIDARGRVKATKFFSLIAMDIWGLDTYQRELASGVITNYITNQFKMRDLGFIDFKEATTRSRGFDLTDRILQFHSHQISIIWRRILFFLAEFEVVIPVKKFSGGRVQQFIFDNEFDSIQEQFIVGDEFIPYPIWERIQRSW